VGCVLAVLACRLTPRRGGSSLLAGVVLAAVTATGLTTPLGGWGSPVWAAPPFVLGLPAAFVLLSGAVRAELEPGVKRAGPRTVAAGAVGWVVLLFVYYAGYDLGYRADVVLVALAIMGAGMGMRAAPDATVGPWPRPARSTYVVAVLAVVVALVGPAVTLRPLEHPKPTADRGATLHVAAWNLRMGYGIDGRFAARAVARTLLREHVDVALVSEIDRGWLLNGGQDQLRILARLTGMHVAFGAAADPVWGDAILSREPLRDVDSHPFPSYGAVTGAEVLRARFDWHGSAVTVLSTHLQPGAAGTNDTVGQARRLARLMRREAELGPVIAGGDLNTAPGSRAWSALLGAGLTDALASVRPLLTSSADDPTEQIDHLFVSPELTTSRPRTLTSELSDHLPVLLDVRVPKP
ncbi:MAG: hypothetical protein JWO46_2835, partial [Nocardioidaceae bacterium]|nr:hypothetical protein [Nocardioidaceae bacterium]